MFVRIATSAALAVAMSSAAVARDFVSIAGSSTVAPFSTIVAERFGRGLNQKTPVVESVGSSAGKKSVCDGVGTQYTDIGNASSRMKTGELEYCDKNGVKLTEITIGFDGIAVANAKDAPVLTLTLVDLGKALTAKVPNADATGFIDNPYKRWNEVNPALPNMPIRVIGPPTTSGTRASYVEIVNEKGYCGKDEAAKKALKAVGEKAKVCRAMRTDGAFIEGGEQDNLIVQKVIEDKEAIGIFGYSYLDQNSDRLKGASLNGVVPTIDTIADGSYPASRAMYFYVKHQHIGVVPGIEEYMTEWTKHWGDDGALLDAGMIPMPKAMRDEMAKRMKDLPLLTAADLK